MLRRALRLVAVVVFAVAGVWELILVFAPINSWLAARIGYLSVPLVLFSAPAWLPIAPFFFALVRGWWTPMIVGYGGGFVAFGLFAVADVLSKDHGRN